MDVGEVFSLTALMLACVLARVLARVLACVLACVLARMLARMLARTVRNFHASKSTLNRDTLHAAASFVLVYFGQSL